MALRKKKHKNKTTSISSACSCTSEFSDPSDLDRNSTAPKKRPVLITVSVRKEMSHCVFLDPMMFEPLDPLLFPHPVSVLVVVTSSVLESSVIMAG